MSDKTFKTITTYIIALALFSSSILLPYRAQAATNSPLNWNAPNGKSPFQFSASSVFNAGTFTAVIGCTGIVDQISNAALQLVSSVTSQALGWATGNDPVPVKDAGAVAQLKTDAQRTACLDGIAYALARQQLVSMTKSTMNWVNSGFNGDPMYVRDITALTDSAERQILNSELNLFKNPKMNANYPYGASFAQSQIIAYKSLHGSGDSLQADITAYLTPGSTVQSFSSDFSQGGWGGWLALTQKDANNPLGYAMNKSQQIADKQANSTATIKATVAQNGGFLDQKKCVLWNEVDPLTGDYQTEQVYDGENGWVDKTKTTTKERAGNSTLDFPDECAKYATVTPGSLIQDKVSKYLNSPETQLELSDSINKVLYSLFSNLINKFQNNGLASLSSTGPDFSSASSDIGSNSILDANGRKISAASETGFDTSSNFDISKDLSSSSKQLCLDDYPNGIGTDATDKFSPKQTCGIIEIQQKYIQEVQKLFPTLDIVMFKLGKLDYCIPGPNPNWQANSGAKDAYAGYLNAMVSVGSDTQYYVGVPSKINRLITDNSIITQQKNAYQNYLDNINESITNYWKDLQNSWYFNSPEFYIAYKENASELDLISRITDERTNEVDLEATEYQQKQDARYGYGSKMQTEYNIDSATGVVLSDNTDYLPMAQTGLNSTKDIGTYAQTTSDMRTTYQNRIIETNTNIYKLTKLSDKINAIVVKAQAARDAARSANGEAPITKECKANEKVNITQL